MAQERVRLDAEHHLVTACHPVACEHRTVEEHVLGPGRGERAEIVLSERQRRDPSQGVHVERDRHAQHTLAPERGARRRQHPVLVGARPRVIGTRRLPDPVQERAAELFDVELNTGDDPLPAARLADAMRSADGVLVTVTDRVDSAVLGVEARRARIVANFGVGHDHIDLEAAGRHGIAVTNTPGVLTDDTADLAMALLLAVLRRVGEGERHLRSGRWTGWRPTHMLGIRATGATLGIVGMGRIGRAVAARAHHGFGMQVRYFQPRPIDPATLAGLPAVPCASVEELLATCEVISLHCPSTPQTRNLIDADRLALMRPGSVLINTARGDLVDEVALAHALVAGPLAGAGLDVYAQEPRVPAALMELENVVLLPHLGSATVQARRAMGDRAIDNLAAFFAGHEAPDRLV